MPAEPRRTRVRCRGCLAVLDLAGNRAEIEAAFRAHCAAGTCAPTARFDIIHESTRRDR